MNIATYVSLSACLVGLLFATVVLAIAPAPGSRGLRVFSLACVWGALYAATNATVATSSFELSRWGIRLGLAFVGLHGATWFVYGARRDGRALSGYERVFIGGLLACAVMTPVPNLLYRSNERWVHDVSTLGIWYTDARSTVAGDVAFGFMGCAMIALLWRSLRHIRTANRTERAEAVGLSLLAVCGVNDALATADVIQSPYLLDVGFLALVVSVGSSLARRFVDNARELASAQTELVQRERLAALGEMSAVVAHEVRNPVAIIFNAAASMRRNPDERDALLAIVEEEAGRLKQMVTDLLDFATPSSLRLADEALADIIHSALDAVRRGRGDEKLDVDVVLDDEVPSLACDVRLLRQAIVNLVANALQAPGRKGPVRITVAKREGCLVQLTVIDDGAGVAHDIADRIFRPFFTTRATGTGLGLAVAQRIVRAHGGEIMHRETPGGGASFEVELPLHPPASIAPTRSPSHAAGSR